MHKVVISILLFLISLFLHSQEWCGDLKPAKLDKPPSSFNNKLVSDRFNHTISPFLVSYKSTQIEAVTIFRNEILVEENWVNSPSDFSYNIYNGLKMKHALNKKLEFHITYIDFMAKVDEEVRVFDRNNVNTSLSFGAKYMPAIFKKSFYKMALYGQLTMPKPENILRTYLSPEVRLIVYRPFMRRCNITYNIGLAYSNYSEGITLIDGILLKMNLGKRIEPFAEFYKNYTTSGPPRDPHKRGLLGIGFYIFENLYMYSSCEAGWYHEESLNTERFDVGLTYRFNKI